MDAAEVFFSKARQVLGVGGYDYAIHLFLLGLSADPDNVQAHRELREIAVRRRAAGGKPLGMYERMKTRPKTGADDKTTMLALEKLLAYEPADLSILAEFIRHAHAAGFAATAAWAQSILDAATRA